MLKLENINLKLGEFELKDINLRIEEGEYYVILGLSGAGKSLLLECISGLKTPQSGKIFLDKVDITNHKIQQRSVGYVFQDHAVFPHLNVYDNIAYSLKKKFNKQKTHEKVLEMAKIVNIRHLLNRDTKTLSGGESQRVALARTLIRNPKCILLDEPFSSLDVQLRDDLRSLFRKINRMGKTIVHVTHDYEEATTLASKIAVFHKGKIVQDGNPSYVFSHPKSKFVARFKGIRNFFVVKMTSENTALYQEKIEIEIPKQNYLSSGFVILNSQDLKISRHPDIIHTKNRFNGEVKDIIPSMKGNEVIVDAGIKLAAFLRHREFEKLDLKLNEKVWIYFKTESVKYLISDKK